MPRPTIGANGFERLYSVILPVGGGTGEGGWVTREELVVVCVGGGGRKGKGGVLDGIFDRFSVRAEQQAREWAIFDFFVFRKTPSVFWVVLLPSLVLCGGCSFLHVTFWNLSFFQVCENLLKL